jgi:hypothetical protein
MFDTHKNLALGTVLSAPADGSGQDFVLMPGHGEGFGINMPVTLCPPNAQPKADNSEIGYVTSAVGDALTILRAQEGSLPMQVEAGWQVYGSLTAKSLQDIEELLEAAIALLGNKQPLGDYATSEELDTKAPLASPSFTGAVTVNGVDVPTTSSTNTLTNKTMLDSTFFIADDADPTKRIQFQISGQTTNTVNVITFPNGTTLTVVGTSATQTLTNKTLTSPKISSGTVPATATSTGTVGQVQWDANYIYVCVATNTWKRAALSTW